ncbi:translation initiation factor 2 [Streptomyces hoynatensis]|uniref:Translation initiation factor 2 n=1 Tax=Streptomyces hoynatensis TaxID=1141874 RepID=A0A3A9YSN0_9ACTN|nr:translation initiation factor 2 [Streptomyces hoynatensis]RKN38975.1 translation initiation factor 2 [Streptomyces hoynatensis]
MLFAARSAAALYRLLDVLPVFAGDDRIVREFTLVPGSAFGIDALGALERAGARGVPWGRALAGDYDLVLAASPKGELSRLRGRRVLLPHGAGFGKSVDGEGTPGLASGLDPAYLLSRGVPLAEVHALAHPSQVSRLAALSPRAAERATVVGDPTLDRLLASRGLRERYRAALGTGGRTLLVVTSTWGPESLLHHRPGLIGELATQLPFDAYQLALVVHPNERSRLGELGLAECLSPALEAGLLLPEPYEEWAAVLVAADAVLSDHGSTALYAAALGHPVLSAYEGGGELLPGSPMSALLARAPRFLGPQALPGQLAAFEPARAREAADAAFAERGRALGLLRARLYALLGLDPPRVPAEARPLPLPAGPARLPSAFAVRVRLRDAAGTEAEVERRPAHGEAAAHHLAAEHGPAGERHAQSAGLLYRRASSPGPGAGGAPYSAAWTAGGWIGEVLERYPGCGAAAVVLGEERCLIRARSGPLLSVRVGACREGGRLVRTDPAAALSGVHAWLPRCAALPAELSCLIGGRSFPVRVRLATAAEAAAVC